MKETLACLMEDECLDAYAILAYEKTLPTRPYLLSRIPNFVPKTVILFLAPYYAGEAENLSVYAAARDYHGYMKELFARLCPALAQASPPYRFFGFSDHSPIDERRAALRAGLGILGKNGLLLHEKYGSFVFIGEIFTDAPADLFGEAHTYPIRTCEGCSACQNACPTGILRGESDACLSAITQKKGELTEEEIALIRENGTAWGCDACQSVCPYNTDRIRDGRAYTLIPYFREARIPHLSLSLLRGMSEEEFAARAFSFRGRAPLKRNLEILEK